MKRGFTLIELLIVIGIIAILAASIIIAINPGAQFAQARDAARQGHINSINNALVSYMVSNYGDLSALGIAPTATEICAFNATSCTGLIDLTPLIEGGHLSTIPTDPSGGVDTNGTGYFIVLNGSNIGIIAQQAETKDIVLGSIPSWTCGDDFTDDRDGQTYSTVQIGSQCWMAENLAYDNGCSEVTWVNSSDRGWCGYHTDDTEQQNGFLYQWSVANSVCPPGWHLPTDTEQHTLDLYLTDSGNACSPTRDVWGCDPAGTKLKSGGSSGWNGLLGGYRENSTGLFQWFGSHGFWWSSTPSSGSAWRRHLYSGNSAVYRYANNRALGISVRCLRD